MKWLEEELEMLKELGPTKQARELIGVLPRHSHQAIAKMRTRLGIVLEDGYSSRAGKYAWSFRDCCKLDQTLTLNDFDNTTFQLLIGSMLGDGCISKAADCKNYMFCEGHSVKQLDYLQWKADKLSCFMPRWNSRKNPLICTVYHPIFTSLRDAFYPSRSKCNKCLMPMELLSKLDLFGLMIWYLDDGYLGTTKTGFLSNGRRQRPCPSIAAKGWGYEQLVKSH